MANTSTTGSRASTTLNASNSTGSVNDSVTTSRTSTSATITSSVTVQNVNLLAGAVTAGSVNAVANSSATTTTATSTNTSSFNNLVIGGTAVPNNVTPNTTRTIPNLGTAVLDEQSGPVNSANSTNITVTAIDIHITVANNLGLPVGSHILIGNATTNFSRTLLPALVSAYSYGLYQSGLSSTVSSSPYAPVGVSCTGGNGVNSINSASISPAGTTGAITDYANGSTTLSGATATGESIVQNVSLLGSLLHATSIKSVATASDNGTPSALGYTAITGGTLAGVPLPLYPHANTGLTIPGVGYVYLNEISTSTAASGSVVTVNAIDLRVTQTNLLGLPVGTRIIVAHSTASVILA